MNSRTRYAAHFVYAGENLIHRNSYIERGRNSLQKSPLSEGIEHTLFYNGILIPVSPSIPFTPHEIVDCMQRNQAQNNKLSIFENLSLTLDAYITKEANAKISLLEGDLLSCQLLPESALTEF